MNTALHQDLIWCLQALSQDTAQQRQLYPNFVHLVDELVLDFDQALDVVGRDILDRNPDLAELDALIDSKGGLSKYWSDEATRRVRLLARDKSTGTQRAGQTRLAGGHAGGHRHRVCIMSREMSDGATGLPPG